MRRVGVRVLLVAAFALATAGADSCTTGGTGTDLDTTGTPTYETTPPETDTTETTDETTPDDTTEPDTTETTPDDGTGCADGYDPCVPSYPPDLDCSDVGGPVQVTGDDPHGLDADGDGVGCE